MLERSSRNFSGRLLELADQLPAVKRVEKVDIAGSSAKYFDRKVGAVLHVNAGRLLIGVASVLKFHFFHIFSYLLAH